MKVQQFKRHLATLVREDRNREAADFVASYLPRIKSSMSAADRMLIADWMEGVEMALDAQPDASNASSSDGDKSGMASA